MTKSAAVWVTKGLVVVYEGHDYVVTAVTTTVNARGYNQIAFDLRPSWRHEAERFGLRPVAGVSYRKVERKPGPAGLRELLRLG